MFRRLPIIALAGMLLLAGCSATSTSAPAEEGTSRPTPSSASEKASNKESVKATGSTPTTRKTKDFNDGR
jgi:hypothetical protein